MIVNKGGRPKGKKDSKPRLTAARKTAMAAASAGITPLEVMLEVMRARWQAGDEEGAVAAAEKAAPYLHSRLASETHRVINDDSQRSPIDIEREIAALDQLAAAATETGDVAPAVPSEPTGLVH